MNVRETIYYLVGLLLSNIKEKFSSSEKDRESKKPSALKKSLKNLDLFSLFGFYKPQKELDENDVLSWFKKRGMFIALLTFIILFFINFGWSLFNFRLFPDCDSEIYNYAEDIPNLINYSIIAPLYVPLEIAFLIFIRRLRHRLKVDGVYQELEIKDNYHKPRLTSRVIWFLIIAGVFLLAFFFYKNELTQYKFIFWFQNMNKSYSFHGYFYLISNGVLLFLTILMVAAHIEIFKVSSMISKGIKIKLKKGDNFNDLLKSNDNLVKVFSFYSMIYVMSKFLVVLFIINMYTWKAQDPNFVGMLDLSIFLIAIGGAALVSFPRYHIQYWIFQLWKKDGILGYPEIRRIEYKGLANLADFFILGTAMTNLITYVLNKSGITITIF